MISTHLLEPNLTRLAGPGARVAPDDGQAQSQGDLPRKGSNEQPEGGGHTGLSLREVQGCLLSWGQVRSPRTPQAEQRHRKLKQSLSSLLPSLI